ncbi:MAG: replicative DNA helicase [Alphaproteobacteria bacterium]|nr:replicative DNA helicase [Alphaproteobacteria bacterium]
MTPAPETNIAPLHGGDDTDPPIHRSPPHNTEIEAALLGAILTNNRAYDRIGDFLRAEHFFEPVHGRIYAAAEKLIEQGQVASPLTLKYFFEKDEALADVGGGQYLFDVAASVVTVINAADYGKTIHDLHLRRQLILLGEDMVNDAYEPDIETPANEQIEVSEQKLYDLANTGELERTVVGLGDAVKMAVDSAEEAFRRDSHIIGITTGLKDLDHKLGGLHSSDLLILAGRPSMGKTALATNIAFNAASAFKQTTDEDGRTHTDGGHVLFFSLEMSAEQLAARILSEQAEISSDAIRRGDITGEDFDRLVVASQKLSALPLYIDDTPALTISGLRTRARRLKRQQKLHLIVVDYLQLLQGAPGKRSENRVQEISEITRGLKTLAKELEVPVLALSQLSRQVENREDKRPQLSDLRESGSIEQDSDVVMFIFREEYYLEKAQPLHGLEEAQDKFSNRAQHWAERLEQVRNTASVIIAKQRHGPVGTIDLFFDGKFTRFADLDRQHGEDGF